MYVQTQLVPLGHFLKTNITNKTACFLANEHSKITCDFGMAFQFSKILIVQTKQQLFILTTLRWMMTAP